MSEFRRLGRREAYRLGTLRTPGAGQRAPRPLRMSFAPRHRGPTSLWALGFLAGTAAVAAATAAGLWFLPFLVGVAAGFSGRLGRWRARAALASAVAMTLAGWAISLGLAASHGAAAGSAAVLPGLTVTSAAGVAVTLLAGWAEAVAGAWAGLALATPAARWLYLWTGPAS